MPRAHGNGIELHYADSGHGEAVLFLNGLAGDHLYWMSQIRACSRHFRCLAPDNRDVGRSSPAAIPYSLADMADDLAAFLQALEISSAHVVGLSLGSMVAQELALRRPSLVRSLVLTSTSGRTDAWFAGVLDILGLIRLQAASTSAFFEALLPWLVSHRYFDEPEHPERLKVLIRQNPFPQPADGFFRQLAALRAHDTLDRLGKIQCPALVIAGEDDLLIPVRYGKMVAERISGARLVLMPGVGHSPPLEDGRAFNHLLREFLNDVGERG